MRFPRQARVDIGRARDDIGRVRDDKLPFAAETWTGAEQDLSNFGAVVAFGTEESLRAIRAGLAPTARFIAYGPACSIGYITRESLASEDAAERAARGAARDLVLYEGEGCLSLHALFVEDGGRVSPQTFAKALASSIERANVEFPPRAEPDDVAKRMTARDLALFRGTLLSPDGEARYVLERGCLERPPAFLPRVLAMHVARDPGEMTAYVRRHELAVEACAVAGSRSEAVAAAIAAGAHRIAQFGEMQAPPLDYAHGGRPRIAEFVNAVREAVR